jgi:hypothetical protein
MTKRNRDIRDKKLRIPNPDIVVQDLLRFLLRRTGKLLYQVRVAFNRSFLPRIPRAMRPDVINWFDQMTTERGRFFEDADGALCDRHF